ncbi:hypothetical protein AGMMS50229_13230 [Campylobacterota bacterium]|nr:hypothetical protein AGMMS50229_13230 [Campylobacterota bacterium]
MEEVKKSNWQKVKLGEIAINFDNQRIPIALINRKKLKKIYPYYGAQGIIDYVEDYIFDGEYLLVAEDGENLKSQNQNIVNFVNGKFWVNNHSHILQANKISETKFLYYSLSCLNIKPLITGSAQPKLTKENLNLIEISLPPLGTQKQISRVLSLLDDKIELNRKIAAELELLARTLYDWHFVQNRNAEWKVEKLEDLLKFEKGSEPGSTAYSDTQENENFVKFYRVGDIDGNCKTWVDKTAHDLVFVKPDEVVVTFDGSVGKIGIGLEGAISSGLQKISDPTGIFANALIWLIFSDTKIVATIEQYATGSVLKHASRAINYLKLSIPDTAALVKFSEAAKPIFAQIVQARRQSANLAKLRDFLLPLMMSGEVEIGL